MPWATKTNMRRKLVENLKRVRERIHAACERCGRQPEGICLVAVTKTVEVDVIRSGIETGLLNLGENRVQDLVKRAGMVREYLNRRRAIEHDHTVPQPRWHMVGHLQRNKVRMVLPWIESVHSVDSLRLAEEIGAQATNLGKTVRAMIEVNVSGEKAKFGIAVGAVAHLIANIITMPGIEIVGLMTMAPLVEDPEQARPSFARLREVLEDVRAERIGGPAFRELSMGMSNDFEVAIEEGATIVRIGRALFDGVA